MFPLRTPRSTRSSHRAGSGDGHELPLEPGARLSRLRRGGPRTPIPLLPVIAVAAGIGIAYVSQTAHATQSTYEASSLAAQHQQLQAQDQQLGDELGRLRSSERIVSAAQSLGMQPANQWAYVASKPVQVLPTSPAPQLSRSATASALQQLVAALSGVSAPGSGQP